MFLSILTNPISSKEKLNVCFVELGQFIATGVCVCARAHAFPSTVDVACKLVLTVKSNVLIGRSENCTCPLLSADYHCQEKNTLSSADQLSSI